MNHKWICHYSLVWPGMPRDAQSSDKVQITNISVTSSVIVLLFFTPSWASTETSVGSCHLSRAWQACPSMLKVLWNNKQPLSQETVELLSWCFCMQLDIHGNCKLIYIKIQTQISDCLDFLQAVRYPWKL